MHGDSQRWGGDIIFTSSPYTQPQTPSVKSVKSSEERAGGLLKTEGT